MALRTTSLCDAADHGSPGRGRCLQDASTFNTGSTTVASRERQGSPNASGIPLRCATAFDPLSCQARHLADSTSASTVLTPGANRARNVHADRSRTHAELHGDVQPVQHPAQRRGGSFDGVLKLARAVGQNRDALVGGYISFLQELVQAPCGQGGLDC